MNSEYRILLEYKHTIEVMGSVICELQECANRLLESEIGFFEPVQLLGNAKVMELELERVMTLIKVHEKNEKT